MEREVDREVDGEGEEVAEEAEVVPRGAEGLPMRMTKPSPLGEEGTSQEEEAGKFSKTTWRRRYSPFMLVERASIPNVYISSAIFIVLMLLARLLGRIASRSVDRSH